MYLLTRGPRCTSARIPRTARARSAPRHAPVMCAVAESWVSQLTAGGWPGYIVLSGDFNLSRDGTILSGILYSQGYPGLEVYLYGADGSVTFVFGLNEDDLSSLQEGNSSEHGFNSGHPREQ